jgi:TfoX/Sxy family transcriptional regulator of competence genes
MAYSEALADRVREYLYDTDPDEEIGELKMMGGLCFMYRGKMLAGIVVGGLMCRVDPELMPELLERSGCEQMMMGANPMKGYVLIDELTLRNPKEFRYYLQLALDYNPRAKASGRKGKP